MPRLARIVIPYVFHHVTQRGNNQQDIFFVDDDRQRYLMLMGDHCKEAGVEIHGYCLMNNHVHLLLLPRSAAALAQAVGRAHFRYTQYINNFHGRSGHLWQGRFFSCALDERHFWEALRYTEQNPVRAKIVRDACDYDWSSARAHVAEKDTSGFLEMSLFLKGMDGRDWRRQLDERADVTLLEAWHRAMERGWPLASDRWIAKAERFLGRRLRPLPIGWQKGRSRRVEKSQKPAK